MGLYPEFLDYSTVEHKRQRLRYWEFIRRARSECRGLDLYGYIAEEYGIEVILDAGNITDRYNIIDEQKYLMLVLRNRL